jgi:hypothetical protein
METTAAHLNRPGRSSSIGTALSPEEIDAWLGEVGVIARAVARRGAAASPDRRRWLAEQARVAGHAVDRLECEVFEAEALGLPTQDLDWLLTRVSALLQAVEGLPALAAAA